MQSCFVRVWHILTAAGAAFIIVALLLADNSYRMQDGKEIYVSGHMVCLPHKQDIFGARPGTDKCAFGFKADDEKHFAISDLRRFTEIPASSEQIVLSSMFTYGSSGPYEKVKYDVVGSIQVSSWMPSD